MTQKKNLLARLMPSTLLAFAMGTSGATPPPQTGSDEETYWKISVVDAVIAMRPCPETGVCGHLVWFNPDDAGLHRYFGDPARKATTPEELSATFCRFSPRMNIRQTSDTTWEGTIEARGMRMNLNIEGRLVTENRVDVKMSKAFVSKRDSWVRISATDPRYPHCTKAP